MYLDDGVSRHSAPTNAWLCHQEIHADDETGHILQNAYGDKKAADMFREVIITQDTVRRIDDTTSSWCEVRTIKISTPVHLGVMTTFTGYSDADVLKSVGPVYKVAIWHPDTIDINTVEVVKQDGINKNYKPWTNTTARVTLLEVPTGMVNKAVIEVQNAV